jgi:hypothetical protein
MVQKKGNEYSMKEAIDEMLKTYRLDRKLSEAKLLSGWERIMGPVIAKYTGDIRITNGVLYVEVKSAALREELSFGKSKIIEVLNAEAGSELIREVILL